MSEMRPTLLFYCQHSLGLGHLSRSFALSEELSRRFHVVLLCGGKLPRGKTLPDGVDVIPLPPLGAAMDGRLVSHDRRRSLEGARVLRRSRIVEVFRSLRPQVVLIEFFPFGKRRFGDELIPLLDEASGLGSAAPVIACSVRDILVGRGDEQASFDDQASKLANHYFDAVLVHSDPKFARLDESFHPTITLRTPVHYTGFVASAIASRNGSTPRRGLVVSAGGGIAGAPLMKAVADAHRLLDDLPARLIAGPFFPEDDWRWLQKQTAGRHGLQLKRSVPNLRPEMEVARASISQCGYNTALDILLTRTPALVVPFAENGEDEQTKRARRLQQLGVVRVLDPAQLRAATLADEIRALLRFRPRHPQFDLRGGPTTVRVLTELHAARFGKKAS